MKTLNLIHRTAGYIIHGCVGVAVYMTHPTVGGALFFCVALRACIGLYAFRNMQAKARAYMAARGIDPDKVPRRDS